MRAALHGGRRCRKGRRARQYFCSVMKHSLFVSIGRMQHERRINMIRDASHVVRVGGRRLVPLDSAGSLGECHVRVVLYEGRRCRKGRIARQYFSSVMKHSLFVSIGRMQHERRINMIRGAPRVVRGGRRLVRRAASPSVMCGSKSAPVFSIPA